MISKECDKKTSPRTCSSLFSTRLNLSDGPKREKNKLYVCRGTTPIALRPPFPSQVYAVKVYSFTVGLHHYAIVSFDSFFTIPC